MVHAESAEWKLGCAALGGVMAGLSGVAGAGRRRGARPWDGGAAAHRRLTDGCAAERARQARFVGDRTGLLLFAVSFHFVTLERLKFSYYSWPK